MFYIVSKVFWVLAQPISVTLLLSLIGLVLVWLRWRRTGMALIGTGALVLGLASFSSIGFVLIGPLENRFVRPVTMPERVDAIVVLGGSTLARVSTARGIAELNEAGDRLVQAVVLAQRYPEARIVFSGGSGIMDPGAEAEAATAERFFLDLGIAPERLVLEDQSRNTDENADLTAALLGDDAGVVMLVTSAFHMPRSVGLFRKVGVNVVPWPTDYRSMGNEWLGVDLSNPVHSLNTTSIAIKEWIGLAAYYWTGRIDQMLPDQASN